MLKMWARRGLLASRPGRDSRPVLGRGLAVWSNHRRQGRDPGDPELRHRVLRDPHRGDRGAEARGGAQVRQRSPARKERAHASPPPRGQWRDGLPTLHRRPGHRHQGGRRSCARAWPDAGGIRRKYGELSAAGPRPGRPSAGSGPRPRGGEPHDHRALPSSSGYGVPRRSSVHRRPGPGADLGTTDIDRPRRPSGAAPHKNPANPNQLFAFWNTTGAGMLAVRSTDEGAWFYRS
jgi:hypothetical protein